MAEDALKDFDMDQFQKPSVFLKFEPGKAVVVRVLTTDPVLYNTSFEDKKKNETVVTTKFAWIVYNFTKQMAQVMQTTPNLAKKLQELHVDPDFGANLKEIDLKITPPAAGIIAAYDVQVLPKPQEMTNEQVKECLKIKLDELFEDKGGMRMTSYDPKKFKPAVATEDTDDSEPEPEMPEGLEDGEPIDLNDIPF